MNINVNKQEYRLLLDMLAIADWIMHAYSVGKEDYHEKHEALKNKLLSYYKEMGAEDIIDPSEELGVCYETKEYEDYIQEQFIEPYEDEYFWDELIEQLGKRDLLKSIGIEQYNKMELIERITKLDEKMEQYGLEFEEHGIDRLQISREEKGKK